MSTTAQAKDVYLQTWLQTTMVRLAGIAFKDADSLYPQEKYFLKDRQCFFDGIKIEGWSYPFYMPVKENRNPDKLYIAKYV